MVKLIAKQFKEIEILCVPQATNLSKGSLVLKNIRSNGNKQKLLNFYLGLVVVDELVGICVMWFVSRWNGR